MNGRVFFHAYNENLIVVGTPGILFCIGADVCKVFSIWGPASGPICSHQGINPDWRLIGILDLDFPDIFSCKGTDLSFHFCLI